MASTLAVAWRGLSFAALLLLLLCFDRFPTKAGGEGRHQRGRAWFLKRIANVHQGLNTRQEANVRLVGLLGSLDHRAKIQHQSIAVLCLAFTAGTTLPL
jgi:hypothetical protein